MELPEELCRILGMLEENLDTKIKNNNIMIKAIQQQLRRLRAQLGHQRKRRNEAMVLLMATPGTPGDMAQREQTFILSDNCVRALERAIRLGTVNLQAKLIIKRTLLVEMAWLSF